MSQLLPSGVHSSGASASASVLPMNIQGWFSLELTSLLSLLSEGLSKSLPQHHSLKTLILQCPAFFMVQLSHLYMTTEKTVALTIRIFVRKVMPLLFNMLSRLVIAFLPRSKWFLVSQLHSLSAVILEPKKISLPLFSFVSHLFAMKWWDQIPWSSFFELSFKPAFSLSSFTYIKRLFSSSLLSAIRVVSSAYLLAILILACDSSSLAFHMMYSA